MAQAFGSLTPSHAFFGAISILSAVLVVKIFRFVLAAREWFRVKKILQDQFPSAPGGHWLLGHAKEMQQPLCHHVLTEWSKELGKAFYLRMAWHQTLVLTDPDMINELMDRTRYPLDFYRTTDEFLFHMDVLTGAAKHPTLLTAKTSDPYWKVIRKGVVGAFNAASIRHGFDDAYDITMRIVEGIKKKKGAPVEVDNIGQRHALDTLGLVGFGKDFGSTKDLDAPNAEADAFHIIDAGLEELVGYMSNPTRQFLWFMPEARKCHRQMRTFHKLMENLYQEVCAKGPVRDDDPSIAGYLRRVKDPFTGGPLSDSRLMAEFAIIFLAGIDTTGHSIGFALFRMATQPEARAKVEAELDQLGLLVTPERPNPRRMEFADLANLNYLSCFMKESQRLTPVAGQGVRRTVKRDTTLGGFKLPKGTILWGSFRPLFRCAELWDRPEDFLPERWFEPGAEYVQRDADKGTAPQSTADKIGTAKRYMPFGDGVRQCIGMSLAKMDYLTALAVLTSHFTMRLADEMGGEEGVYSREVSRITVAVRGGLKIHFYPRLDEA